MDRILIFSATYNESENIESLIQEIFKFLPGQEVLIVDDSSPDGTGELLDKLAVKEPRIHVIHRPKKLGLGTAHKLAMKYAIHYGFDILITMDADYSHHPKYLPIIAKNVNHYDFVIGSRYIKGGGLNYGFIRASISRTANILTRRLLGIRLKECTTSYRGFRITLLKKLNIDAIQSEGYSFFVESIFYISRLTDNIIEFPIYFEDRRAGESKISKKEIVNGFLTLVRLFYMRLSKHLPMIKNDESFITNNNCNNCGSPFQSNYMSPQQKSKTVSCLQCGVSRFGESGSDHEKSEV